METINIGTLEILVDESLALTETSSVLHALALISIDIVLVKG